MKTRRNKKQHKEKTVVPENLENTIVNIEDTTDKNVFDSPCSDPLIRYLQIQHTIPRFEKQNFEGTLVEEVCEGAENVQENIPRFENQNFEETLVEEVCEAAENVQELCVKTKKMKPFEIRKARSDSAAHNFEILVKSGAHLEDIMGKKDEAWEKFKRVNINGKLLKKYYCGLCWEKGRVQEYELRCSLSSLKKHLLTVHDLDLTNRRMATLNAIMAGSPYEIKSKKEELIVRLALKYIMTLTPFHQIENKYERDFLMYSGLIKDPSDAPSERSLSDNGLEKLYLYCRDMVTYELKNSPQMLVTLFDGWSDLARRSYFAIILRFLTDTF